MKVTRTTDTKENLCDSCPKRPDFPTCIPDDVEFGNGIGNDNITVCSNCAAPTIHSKTMYIGEI